MLHCCCTTGVVDPRGCMLTVTGDRRRRIAWRRRTRRRPALDQSGGREGAAACVLEVARECDDGNGARVGWGPVGSPWRGRRQAGPQWRTGRGSDVSVRIFGRAIWNTRKRRSARRVRQCRPQTIMTRSLTYRLLPHGAGDAAAGRSTRETTPCGTMIEPLRGLRAPWPSRDPRWDWIFPRAPRSCCA